MEFKKKLGWIIVAAFIIGFAISWIVLGMGSATPEGGDSSATSTESISSPAGPNALSVANQVSGLTVAIDSVTLENSGWVAIHEERDGGLGNILGAAWIPEGTSENVSIDLLRATAAERSYYAVLHGDNGDRTFDYHIDLPLVSETNAPIAVKFFTENLSVEE